MPIKNTLKGENRERTKTVGIYRLFMWEEKMFDYVKIQETVFDRVDIVYKYYNDYLVLYIGEYNKWLILIVGILLYVALIIGLFSLVYLQEDNTLTLKKFILIAFILVTTAVTESLYYKSILDKEETYFKEFREYIIDIADENIHNVLRIYDYETEEEVRQHVQFELVILQERIGIGIPERKAESIKYLIRNTAGDIEEHVVDIYKKVKDEPEEESDVQKIYD